MLVRRNQDCLMTGNRKDKVGLRIFSDFNQILSLFSITKKNREDHFSFLGTNILPTEGSVRHKTKKIKAEQWLMVILKKALIQD